MYSKRLAASLIYFVCGISYGQSAFDVIPVNSTFNLNSPIQGGDFNNDGTTDIAAVSSTGSLEILYNTVAEKKCRFASPVQTGIAVGDHDRIILNDLDNDRYPDLIIITSNQISIYRNNTQKTGFSFNMVASIQTKNPGMNLICCDLIAGGVKELIANTGSTIIIYSCTLLTKNDFHQVYTFNCNHSISDIKCTDIDGDGNVDIAASGIAGLNILKGDGKGNFKDHFSETALPLNKMDVGDIDGDFQPDIVCSHWPANDMTLFRNNSSANSILFEQTTVIGSAPVSQVTISDFDQDGKLDLASVVAGRNIHAFSIYKNTGNPESNSFSMGENYELAGENLIVADFNLDGFIDMAELDQGKLNVRINTPSSTFKNIEVYCDEDGHTMIDWETNAAQFKYFIIEKTRNGIDFTAVNKVNSEPDKGTHYSVYDDGAGAELYMYRIKGFADNNVETSSMLAYEPCESPLTDFVCVYPNPVDKIMNFHFSLSAEMEMHYELLDGNMASVFSRIEKISPGTRTNSIDISNLTAGYYTLVVQFGNLPVKYCRFQKL